MAFLVKGMAAACLDYAPMVLPPNNITQVGSCVLWTTLTLGCVLGAGPAVSAVGSKGAMFIGLLLMDTFYAMFTLCAVIGPCTAQWVLFIAGMFFLGLGASLMLTGVCIYMAQIAVVLVEESPEETLEEVTAHLGGSLAVWSLGTEVVFKLAASALRSFSLPEWAALALWTVLALLCATLFLLARKAPHTAAPEGDNGTDKGATKSEVLAFFSLWSSPRVWLIGFTNFTFSFTDTLLLNYINPHYIAPMLGESSIGICMSVVSLVGAALAKPYSFSGAYLGNGFILTIGAVSFATIPLAVLFSDLCTEGGWWVLILFCCYGSGRAVQEGLNRAVFAEHFPGHLLNPAYANFNFQSSTISAVSNFAQTVVSNDFLLFMPLGLAVATPPCYALAACLRGSVEGEDEEASNGTDQSSSDEL